MTDLTTLSDEDLHALQGDAYREIQRRQTLRAAPDLAANLSRDYLLARDDEPDPENPPAWTQPTGAHDAYPLDYTVTHGGARWASLVPANVWEPGVSGWREVAGEGSGPAAWAQPTGAHDAYGLGDRVTHGGHLWESSAAANVWEPGVYGWTDLGPA